MARRAGLAGAVALGAGRRTVAEPGHGEGAAGRVVHLPPEAVHVGERLRAVDPEAVADLARSMGRQGLLNPIHVRLRDGGGDPGDWELVAGAHRLAAARRLGWRSLPATVFDGNNRSALLAEIDGNLAGNELNPLDRVRFLRARRDAMRDGGDDPGGAGIVGRPGEVSGLSRAGVYRDLQFADRLDPEAAEVLRGTAPAVRRRDLERLSGQPAAVRRETAARIRDTGATLAEALPPSGRRKAGGPRDDLAALKRLRARADGASRERFLRWVRLNLLKDNGVPSWDSGVGGDGKGLEGAGRGEPQQGDDP